jgi:hypothetical protein
MRYAGGWSRLQMAYLGDDEARRLMQEAAE